VKRYVLIIAGVFILLFGAIYTLNLQTYNQKKENSFLLPIYGSKISKGFDTTYHTIADFSFTNQLGNVITQKDIHNNIFVVEYFFSTCQGICPKMNKNMMKVAKTYGNDLKFKILSHTVKPDEDSVATLLAYAEEHNANPKMWWFLTGSKKDLYEMARKSYLMDHEDGDGGDGDFIHTQFFALIDKQKRIRGFYDGTDSLEVTNLIADIALLKTEKQ